MHLSYFLMTSINYKLMLNNIEICFIAQGIQIYQFNFAYLFNFYLFDHISIFIMLLIHI